MEFLQLRYFYENAKNKSFALTAKKHMVPTSSVSAAIKRLETELGTKLYRYIQTPFSVDCLPISTVHQCVFPFRRAPPEPCCCGKSRDVAPLSPTFTLVYPQTPIIASIFCPEEQLLVILNPRKIRFSVV
jgi:hypothetical protein